MHQRRDAGAARLAQQQGGLRVDVDEHDLHHRRLRLVARVHLVDAVEQQLQARGQVALRGVVRADDAAGDVGQARAVGVQHAEAGAAQAGVDAQNPHGSSAARMRPTMTRARWLR